MLSSRWYFVSSIVLICVFPAIILSPKAIENKEAASLAISNAESAILSACQAALEAEQAGSNITDALHKLSYAAGLLANARTMYMERNWENSIQSATRSSEIADEVKIESRTLLDQAVWATQHRLSLTIIESTVSVGAIICGSLVSWRLFKRHCYGKSLKRHQSET